MDFLFHLQSAARNKSKLQFSNITEVWSVPEIHEFYQEDDLKSLDTTKIVPECWLIPTKVNQGCYDALQLILSTFTLRVVQLTVAPKHSLKLRYVISILQTLEQMRVKISSLDVVFVVPPEKVNTFALGKVESDKNKVITDLGWDVSKIRMLGFKRSGIVYDM